MTRTGDELNEYGKRVLAPLHSVPPIDPQVAVEAKKQFLLLGEDLRQGLIKQADGVDLEKAHRKPNLFREIQQKPVMKVLVAVLLAALVILIGSSFTVYAAQSSLPGELLYTIKSWSEDVRLPMTFSTQAKLNLTLDYTNRRIDEISSLLARGKTLNDQTSDRLQRELDYALQLAAQLDDTQIQNALGRIKSHAENQGITMQELINTLPPQAEQAMIRLQERLAEQVQLSTFGEDDPKAFRAEIRERMRKHQNSIHTPASMQPTAPSELSVTPLPGQNGNDNGNKTHQPTRVPGHGGPGNDQGQSTPGNGNHGKNGYGTQEP